MTLVTVNPDLLTLPNIYIESSVFYFKFNSLPLFDSINSQNLIINNSNSLILDSGIFGNCIQLRPNVSMDFPFIMPTKEFSMGFWHSPINIKPVFNPNTGDDDNFILSLIDKANFEFDSITGVVSASSASFVLYEECLSDSNNCMYILLESSDQEQVIYKTSKYKSNIFHHFFISYNGNAEIIDIYIDGIKSNLELVIGSGVPSELNGNISTPLHINNSAIGSNNLLRNNSNKIDDFFMVSIYINDIYDIAKIINFSAENFLKDDLNIREEVYQSFIYDDPTTVTIKDVFNNGSNLYAGRNDGKLLKGGRLLWQARKNFENKEELDFIEILKISDFSSVEIKDKALSIKNSSIRIL